MRHTFGIQPSETQYFRQNIAYPMRCLGLLLNLFHLLFQYDILYSLLWFLALLLFGRPWCGSSSRLVRPRLHSATQIYSTLYESSQHSFIKFLCFQTFQKSNSSTARYLIFFYIKKYSDTSILNDLLIKNGWNFTHWYEDYKDNNKKYYANSKTYWTNHQYNNFH